MVEFAAYTGLRASELAGLEVADLVFAPVPVGAQPKCSVRVERTKSKAKRAGEGWIVGTPEVETLPAYGAAAGLAGGEDGRLPRTRSPPSRRAGCAVVAVATQAGCASGPPRRSG